MASKEIKVARTGEIKNGEMKQVKAGETELLLVRQDGHFYALAAKCTHYGAPLAEGSLRGNKVVCPWHHACFDVTTGKHLAPPAVTTCPNLPYGLTEMISTCRYLTQCRSMHARL
ncbi:MAG: Rieske 2Fe-2S domain-containing protein [Cyclobacteriaceae bacterium]